MKIQKSRQKLFVAMFLLSLTGPTLLYPLVKDRLDTTNYENRTLAAFPELSLGNLEQIPSEFDSWYNDHVPFKNIFVKLKTKIDVATLGQSSTGAVTVGADKWLFYTVTKEGENALADYQHTNIYQTQERENVRRQIEGAKERVEARGMKFYLFEVPNKETVYGQYMPDNVKVYGEYSRLDDIVPWLREECGLPVYYVKDELIQLSDQYQLYYKYDTHWNLAGAFVASQVIAGITAGESVPVEDVQIVPGAEGSGDLARMLNMVEEYSDDREEYVEGYLPQVTAHRVDGGTQDDFEIYESDAPSGRTLFLIGDSYSQYMKQYLPKIYSRCIFVTFDAYEPSMLDEYHADDFIYLTVERNQQRFEHVDTILEQGLQLEE